MESNANPHNRDSYEFEMTEVDRARLLLRLKEYKGRVVLSGYASSLYDELLAGWHRIEIETDCRASNTRSDSGVGDSLGHRESSGGYRTIGASGPAPSGTQAYVAVVIRPVGRGVRCTWAPGTVQRRAEWVVDVMIKEYWNWCRWRSGAVPIVGLR